MKTALRNTAMHRHWWRARRWSKPNDVCESGMPARVAGICGLLTFVTVNIGWMAGGLAAGRLQRRKRRHLRPRTNMANGGRIRPDRSKPQMLVITLALGLWRHEPRRAGRIGAGAMLVAGQARCSTSRIAEGSTPAGERLVAFPRAQIESGITGAATIAAPLILAFAFRRIRMARLRGCRYSSRCRNRVRCRRSRRLGTGRPRGIGRRLPLDRLRQRASASERRPRRGQPEQPAGRRRIAPERPRTVDAGENRMLMT